MGDERPNLLPGDQDGETRNFRVECPPNGVQYTREELLSTTAAVNFLFTLRDGDEERFFAIRARKFRPDPTRDSVVILTSGTAWETDKDGQRLDSKNYGCHGWLNLKNPVSGTWLGELQVYPLPT